MRFVARLRRLARLAALIPPADPLRQYSEAEVARAGAIIKARTPHAARDLAVWAMRGEDPPAKPEVTQEEASWFLATVAPLLPAYEAFLAARERWQGQFRQKPRTAHQRLACIFPAFAEGRFWRTSLPALPHGLLPGLARLAGEGYEPAHSTAR
jgi:hypothetical protein